jgi:WD40 repeat protein
MYDSVSSEKTMELKTAEYFASALSVSHDGSRLAVGNSNGGLFIFNRDRDYKMGRYQLHHKQIRSLAFTEDSAKLVSACDDQTIRVFDIES